MKKGRSSRIYKKSFKRVSYNLAREKKKMKDKRAKKLNKRYHNYSYVYTNLLEIKTAQAKRKAIKEYPVTQRIIKLVIERKN